MLVDHWAADLARGAGCDPADPGVSVAAAHVADTAVLVRLSSGAVTLLRLDPDTLALEPVRRAAPRHGPADADRSASPPIPVLGAGGATTAACLASLAGGSHATTVVLCRQGGALEVYDANTWELVLREEHFVDGKDVLGGCPGPRPGLSPTPAAVTVCELLVEAPSSLALLRPDLHETARPSAVPPSQHPLLLALLSDGALLVGTG